MEIGDNNFNYIYKSGKNYEEVLCDFVSAEMKNETNQDKNGTVIEKGANSVRNLTGNPRKDLDKYKSTIKNCPRNDDVSRELITFNRTSTYDNLMVECEEFSSGGYDNILKLLSKKYFDTVRTILRDYRDVHEKKINADGST